MSWSILETAFKAQTKAVIGFLSGEDWHALYTMAFQDSHYDVEPIAGYGFQKIWRPADDFVSASAIPLV